MKDLRVGDTISNVNGTVGYITQLHPIQTIDKWTVSFDDGTELDVAREHLWAVWRTASDSLRSIPFEVVPTHQLAEWINESDDLPVIPLCDAQEIEGTRLSVIDPYLLGYLLDLEPLSGEIKVSGQEKEHIVKHVYRDLSFTLDAEGNYFLVGQSLDFVKGELKKLGLMDKDAESKFIPSEILNSSLITRVSLLQGILDSSGVIDSHGKVSVITVSEKLSRDICYLVRSLGGTARVIEGKPIYRIDKRPVGKRQYTIAIEIYNIDSYFRIKWKSRSVAISIPLKRVTGVRAEGTITGRCLSVSSGLYITNDFIVTHNSSALLMAALQYVDVPGYAALLLRRTYKDLAQPQALMYRANEWLMGTDAKWNEEKHRWTFPSGASLTFGYLEAEKDKYQYQGAELQFVGFDELTQFTESQYTYLFSRLRRVSGMEVPLRMRAATNPGGVGHVWVKRRFLEEGNDTGRIFIAARVEDNPAIDAVEYDKSLAQLDPIERARLRFGDWDIESTGELFRREWFQNKMIPRDNIPVITKKVRYWDLAASEFTGRNDPDWTAGTLMGLSENNEFIILDVKHDRLTPSGVENLIRQTAVEDGLEVEIYIEQEPGASGKMAIDHYRKNILPDFVFEGVRMTGSKIHRAKPFSGMCEAGHVYLVKGTWNMPFLQELELFPNRRVHDDQVDSASGAYMKLAGASALGGIWF